MLWYRRTGKLISSFAKFCENEFEPQLQSLVCDSEAALALGSPNSWVHLSSWHPRASIHSKIYHGGLFCPRVDRSLQIGAPIATFAALNSSDLKYESQSESNYME